MMVVLTSVVMRRMETCERRARGENKQEELTVVFTLFLCQDSSHLVHHVSLLHESKDEKIQGTCYAPFDKQGTRKGRVAAVKSNRAVMVLKITSPTRWISDGLYQ